MPEPEDAAELTTDDKEAAAWANVGPVSSGADTTAETETEPEADEPDEEESPAEQVTDVPDEPEPVEEDAREEEAGEITPVEDVTDETVVENAAPPTGEGAKLSEAATDLTSDDEDDESKA